MVCLLSNCQRCVMLIYIEVKEKTWDVIIWIFISSFLAILTTFKGLYYFQSYQLVGDNLILKNAFGKMVEINLNNAVYEVKELDSQFFLVGVVKNKWICIYEKNESIKRFEKGCSNQKNKSRIQIIYSEEFIHELEKRKVEKLVE